MSIDLEIARAATLRPIAEIAARAGIPEEALEPYGRHKAKIALDFADRARRERHLGLVQGVRNAVSKQCLYAGPCGENLESAHAARSGIAVTRGRNVAADLADHATQSSQAEHWGQSRSPG